MSGLEMSLYLTGISMGGIMGGLYMSVSTDVERGALIVPGAPFTMLLPRSTGFQSLGDILLLRYPDHADVMTILTALQVCERIVKKRCWIPWHSSFTI